MNRPLKTPTVFIETDDGIEKHTNVADVAEVSDGRLMVAGVDGDQEMVGGSIFGAFGSWKMWFEGPDGTVEKHQPESPIKMPYGAVQFTDKHGRREGSGRIKRLKRIDL